MAQEKGHDSLGKEMRRRMDAVEGEIGALKRIEAQGTGAGDKNLRRGPGCGGCAPTS